MLEWPSCPRGAACSGASPCARICWSPPGDRGAEAPPPGRSPPSASCSRACTSATIKSPALCPVGSNRCWPSAEPSEGLAPQIIAEVMATIRRLKAQGLSILLVEQNAKLVFDVADEVVILNSGRVVIDAPAAELRAHGVDLRQHLGIY